MLCARSSLMTPLVSVPVLSTHSTSMPPSVSMASSRLTMALPEAIVRAPRDRQTVTISGSISGVSPTATDTPNSRACSQSPLAMPVTSMDTGTVTAVNAISIQDVEFMPRSKRVRGRCHWNARDSPPNSALRPVAMTTANAEPESPSCP